MIAAETAWLSLAALVLLVVINSVACAVALTQDAAPETPLAAGNLDTDSSRDPSQKHNNQDLRVLVR